MTTNITPDTAKTILFGYLADSSWFRNPSGGRRYHLRRGLFRSSCGLALLGESKVRWENLADTLKCKKCNKPATDTVTSEGREQG